MKLPTDVRLLSLLLLVTIQKQSAHQHRRAAAHIREPRNVAESGHTEMMMIRRYELVEAESASRVVPKQLDNFPAELPRPRHLFGRLLPLRQRQPATRQRHFHSE